MTSCTVCRMLLPGGPDDDITCADCEGRNFHGDPLRHPPRQQRHPLPWWQRDCLELAPRRDGVRALTCIQGPWTWSPENGMEETTHAD